jgi:hypothetical protein
METTSDHHPQACEISQPSVADTRSGLELQVHLAEYNALTMRNTYWITLQYACWPILLLFWSCAVPLWDKVPQTLFVWICGGVTQAVVASWCEAGHEIYSNATYIEHKLRPKIQLLLGVDQFWGYEPFLKVQRGNAPLWYEYWPMLALAALLALLIFYKRPWCPGDWLGLALYSTVLAVVVQRTARLVKERRRITSEPSLDI